MYNDSTLGTSQVIDQDVTLPSYGEAAFTGIMINVSFLSALTIGAAILKELTSGRVVPILVNVRTIANLGWTTKVIEQTKKVNLKPIA